MEVGCSREIIEGQNSTVQLLALAKEFNLPFAGIDLDSANIEALERDYKENNAVWITGKGEEELKRWDRLRQLATWMLMTSGTPDIHR